VKREKGPTTEMKRHTKVLDSAERSQLVPDEIDLVPLVGHPRECRPKWAAFVWTQNKPQLALLRFQHHVPLTISCGWAPQERPVALQEPNLSAGRVCGSQHMVWFLQLQPCQGQRVEHGLQLCTSGQPLLLDALEHPWPQLGSKDTGSHHKSPAKALAYGYTECHHEALSGYPASSLRLSRRSRQRVAGPLATCCRCWQWTATSRRAAALVGAQPLSLQKALHTTPYCWLAR